MRCRRAIGRAAPIAAEEFGSGFAADAPDWGVNPKRQAFLLLPFLAGALSAPDIDVAGGRVGQDTAGPTCGVISIPVIQSQSILSR